MKHIVFTLTLALALLITGQLSAQQESPAGNINNTLSIIENGQNQPNLISGSALPGPFETTSTLTRSTDNRNNPPAVEWQASFGDNNDKNWGYCASQTSDGGYIMVGAADFDTTGDYNAWLIKTDALGNMLWSKEFGDYFIDEAYVVKEISNGGYIIAGMSTQFGWSGEGWLIRMDASGNVIWNKGYHPAQGGSQSQWDYIYDVWETADGGFITVGQAGQNVNLIQGWIMKVNSSGNRIWENTFGCQYWDRLFSVYPTPDGAYIAAGDRHFSYNGGTTYKHDGWLVKFNASGDTLWTRNYGSKDHDIFRNVMTNDAGEIIVVGQREPTEFGGYEAWIVKTDADGNPIWNNIYGKGAMMDLVMDYEGNYLVAGTTVKPTSAYDAWMMRVNPDGTLMGESFISTTNMDEIPQSFGHTADGGYVLGGRTAANSLLGKFWMVKFEPEGNAQPLTSFYEDFDAIAQPAIPEGWTGLLDVMLTNTAAEVKTVEHNMAPTQPNAIFVMNGLDGSNGQPDPTAFVALVSPLVEVGNAGAVLNFHTQGTNPVVVGMLTDPEDASTFTEIQTVNPTSDFSEFEIQITNPATGHIAFKNGNVSAVTPVFIDAVTFEAGAPVTPLTEFYQDFDGVSQPALPEGWTGHLDVLLSNTVAEIKTAEHGMAPTQPNAVFIMNGLDGSNGQLDPTAFVALVSPPVDSTEEGATLTFQAQGRNPIIVGTMTDTEDAETFVEVQEIIPAGDFAEYTAEFTAPFTGHIALRHGNTTTANPVFVDAVNFEAGLPLVPLTAFFEDFDNAIQPNLPSDWSEVIDVLLTNTIAEVITLGHGEAPTQPYAVFVMNGLDGSNGQLDPTAFVGLVSPLVEITGEGATLSFWAQGSDPIIVGTMTDPDDLSTFIAVDEVTPSMIFTEYTVEFTEPAVTYIVFKHSNQSAAYPIFIDAVALEPGLPVQPVMAFYENFDGVTQPELPQGWNGLLDVMLTNTVAEIKSVEHSMAPTQPNAIFVMNGLDGSNGQIDPTAFAALVSPPVTVTDEGATLTFAAQGTNPVVVGWLTDPQDTSTFTEIQTITPTSDFEVYTVEITTPGAGYIAMKNGNVSAVTPVFLDEVVLEQGLPVVPILPPTDLTAQAVSGEVVLNWSAPQPAGEWLHFDSGENIDGIGLEEGGTFIAAVRWPMDWINPYDGQVIEAVRIFPRSNNNASFTLKIWKGGNASTLLYEQALDNLEQHAWNTIELDNPVVIDGSQWLWAGYEVIGQVAGDYPAGVDAGPAVGGYGDMVFMNGMWSPLSSYDLDYNWNIQILVADNSMEWQPTEGRRVKMIAGNNPSTLAEGKLLPAAHPSIPATDLLQGYNIYRDGVQINENVVEQTSYTDATVTSGDYFYYVTALYSEVESDASNTVEVYVEGNNGQLNGFIRDAVTNLAITTATLTAFGTDNGVFTKTTPFGSHYSMMVPAGTYDVTCTAEGYEPQTAAGLEVIEDANTHYTFYLEPLTDQGGKSSVIRSDETQVYPNPSSGAVTISGTDIREVVIRNGNGQKVYQGEASGETISVAGLKSGLHLIRIIKNSGEEIHEKLIVR